VRRDELTIDLIARMRAVTSFVYGVGAAEAGLSIGTTADDFAYGLQIPSWTLELEPRFGGGDYGGTGASHSGFVLPEAQIARVRDEMAQIHELAFYVQAGPPRVQAVEIREAASGEVVYAAAWQPGVTRTLDVSVNRALLAGTQYRLWLAFDRPMRWRDENGDISEFPGQNVAPFPALTLEAPSLDAELAITGDGSAWLEQPGGAPDGFLRYRDDALGADFTLPAALTGTGATPLVLSIAATDLAAVFIDANPATPVDWRNGHWAGYEDELGEAGDRGGSDCTIQPFSAASADAAPPAGGAICAIALVPPPEPPPPPPPPPPPSSGGGGAAGLGALSAALYALWRRRCRRRATSEE
jgi:hypothetical protein